MKNELKGFRKIFAFTFRQQLGRKGYLVSLILVTLLCVLIPAGVMTGAAWFGLDEEPEQLPSEDLQEETPVIEENIEDAPEMMQVSEVLHSIYVINLSGEPQFSADAMKDFDFEAETGLNLDSITFTDYGEDLEAAAEDSRGSADTLVLVADRQGDSFVLHLLLPEESTMDQFTADILSPAISAYGDRVTMKTNGVTDAETGGTADYILSDADLPEELENTGEMTGEEDPLDSVRGLLGYIIPYLNIMVLYFFVLFYGQGVAQSVITEKSSKLMEFFLVSVKPTAMILGKISAVCCSGILQISSWILGLFAGFGLGSLGARMVDPGCDMVVLQLLDSFGSLTEGMFSIGGIILALLMVVAGMLLYCALAGVGGAVAGKPEDLSSTNVAFSLILVASFLTCLFAGGLDGLGDGSAWLDWIPFTAILVTPARILLGSVSLVKGIGCLAAVLAAAMFFTLLAGRLYQLMALYKGDLPGPKEMVEIMKQK